jgi:hypothetical protein
MRFSLFAMEPMMHKSVGRGKQSRPLRTDDASPIKELAKNYPSLPWPGDTRTMSLISSAILLIL